MYKSSWFTVLTFKHTYSNKEVFKVKTNAADFKMSAVRLQFMSGVNM